MNFAMTSAGEFIELQGTGEEATFTDAQLQAMLNLGRAGIRRLIDLQNNALKAT
jgi:ribonuclease PH